MCELSAEQLASDTKITIDMLRSEIEGHRLVIDHQKRVIENLESEIGGLYRTVANEISRS